MNICSNFHADICMLNIILMLANFGPRFGPGSHALGPVFIPSHIEEYMCVFKKHAYRNMHAHYIIHVNIQTE